MKSSISPAAQAVLDAYGHEVGGIAAITSYERRGIAAALRAAADQVECIDPDDNAFAAGYDTALSDILAIAAELEGSTRDPLEPHDLSHLSEEEFQALAPQGYHGL